MNPYRAALTAVVAFIAALNLPVLGGASVLFEKDLLRWFYPLKLTLSEQFKQGHLPLWTPLLSLGSPVAAMPEMGVFYPLNMLLLFPAPACIGIFLVTHLFIVAIGMFLLLRRLGLCPSACAFGTLAFALSGYTLSMFSASGLYLLGIAWLPLAAASVHAVLSDKRRIGFVGLALSTACQLLSGEAQSVLFSALIAAALAAGLRPISLKGILWVASAFAVALLLAAPQLALTLAQFDTMGRSLGLSFDEARHLSLHPLRLLDTAVLGVFGFPSDRYGYLGFFMNSLGEKDAPVPPWSSSIYLGSFTLLFFFYAFYKPKKIPAWIIPISILGLFGLLAALGERTPIFSIFFRFFPGAGYFRYPEKYFVLLLIAVTAIAAFGVHRLLDTEPIERVFRDRLMLVFAAILLGLIFLFSMSGVLSSYLDERQVTPLFINSKEWIREAVHFEIALFLIGGAALWITRRYAPKAVAVTVPAVLALGLGFAYTQNVQTTDAALYSKEPLSAAYIREHGTSDVPPRILNSPFSPSLFNRCLDTRLPPKIARWEVEALTMNTGLLYGVEYYHAYVGMKNPDHKQFWKETKEIHRALMDLFSIPFGMFPLDHPTARDLSLRRVLFKEYPCMAIYRSETVLPLVRPVEGIEPVRGIQPVIERLKQDGSVRSGRTVLVEISKNDAKTTTVPLNAKAERCEVTRRTDDGLHALCRMERARFIVANIAFHPNIEAAVDGVSTRLYRADGIVSAVEMPPGVHRLSLTYTEPLLKYVAWIPIVTALAGVFFFLVRRRR